MRISCTQKRLGENCFQSVTVVQRLKGRTDDFIAKSEHLVQYKDRTQRKSSYSLNMRGKYKITHTDVAGLAATIGVRNLETALDAALGLKPLKAGGHLRLVN